jgi:anion-transporting  ArsA/GET3 family ATPase
MPDSRWPDATLHVVSGKGGTGKTTVAGALALALARDGRRCLVMEVEGRQGLAQLFDVPPLPYEEKRLAVAPGGGEVWGLAVDAEDALLDYLEIFYNLRRAGAALRRMGAIDFATTLAPGLRDVLLTGKACEVVLRSDRGRDGAYDAVVMDAPPTGRITRFLNVNSEVSGLAGVGPIHNHAELVMGVIGSPRTAIHLVTVLEEMPVQETLDGVDELRAAGLPVGGLIVNMTRSPVLHADEIRNALDGNLPVAQISRDLKSVGFSGEADALAAVLVRESRDHARRAVLERSEIERLGQVNVPMAILPSLAAGIDLAGLYELAEGLADSGFGR